MRDAEPPVLDRLLVHRDEGRPGAWRDLLIETPRDLARLHYILAVGETWDGDGDITATPYSGGRWTPHVSDEQVAALGRCTALVKLRELVVEGLPRRGSSA